MMQSKQNLHEEKSKVMNQPILENTLTIMHSVLKLNVQNVAQSLEGIHNGV